MDRNAACSADGVLDGRDALQRRVRRHPGEQFVEAQAGEDADLPVVEVTARCRFVIASCDALYCDLFHSSFEKENPARPSGIFVSSLIYISNFIQLIARDPAFSLAVKEKVIKIICETVCSHGRDGLYHRQM